MTFKFLRVLPRDKAGGAEVMARAESACVNPEYEQQLLFLYSSDGSRLFNLLSGFGRLFSILRNGSYSVVITSLWPVVPPMIFCRLFIPHHIRWIHFIHSDVFFSRTDRIFSKVAIKMADGILCDSIAARKLVAGISNRKPIEVARPIISLKIPLEFCGQPKNLLHFITWGRIHRHKNLQLAIRFISELVRKSADAQLLIVGPDEEGLIPLLKAEAELLEVGDRVTFTGELSQEEIIKQAIPYGGFLLSSEHEGLCIALTEAMQLGLLPVVTLVGGIREYCEDGKNCIKLDQENPARTAERLMSMSKAESDEIVRKARLTFIQSTDYCTSYYQALDHLIKGT